MKRSLWILFSLVSAGCATSNMPYAIHFPQPVAVANNEYHYIQSGQLNSAVAYCTGSMGTWPNFHGNYALRGLAYYKKGMYEESIADFSKALELQPDVWDLYLDRGRAYYHADKNTLAYADFEKSISLKDNAAARVGVGELLIKSGRYEEALAAFNKALELDPMIDQARGGRGRALLGLKKDQEALSDFDRLAEKHPNDKDIIFLRGVAYFRLGQTQKARDAAQQAIELAPRLSLAFSGEQLLEMFDLEKRRASVKQSLEAARKAEAGRDWDSAFLNYSSAWGPSMGFLVEDKAARDEVQSGLIRAYPKLKEKPAIPEIARRYMVEAKAFIKDAADPLPRDYRKSLASYQALVSAVPWFPDAYYNAALTRAQLKDFPMAIKDMNRYIQLAPDAPDARAAQDKIYEWQAKASTRNTQQEFRSGSGMTEQIKRKVNGAQLDAAEGDEGSDDAPSSPAVQKAMERKMALEKRYQTEKEKKIRSMKAATAPLDQEEPENSVDAESGAK